MWIYDVFSLVGVFTYACLRLIVDCVISNLIWIWITLHTLFHLMILKILTGELYFVIYSRSTLLILLPY